MWGYIVGGVSIIGLSKLFSAAKTSDTADKLTIKPVAVKWSGFKNGALRIDIDFESFNPTSSDFTVNYLYFDVNLSTVTLTTVNQENWNKTFAAERTTKFTTSVSIPITNLLLVATTLGKMLMSGKKPEYIEIKGFAKANNFSTEINKQVKVS